MANDSNERDQDRETPSLRQRLHAATGDRRAEAQVLADEAGDEVTEADAETAVRVAHGDIPSDAPGSAGPRSAPTDVATPADAEAEARRRRS